MEAGLLAQQNRFLLVFYQFRFYNGDARFLRDFLGFKFGENGSPLLFFYPGLIWKMESAGVPLT